MEQRGKKISLGMLVIIILITIVITATVILIGTEIVGNKEEETAKKVQEDMLQSQISTNTLTQNNEQNGQNMIANSNNNLNNDKEYNQYTEMQLNGKKVSVKLRQTIMSKEMLDQEKLNIINQMNSINSGKSYEYKKIQIAINNDNYEDIGETITSDYPQIKKMISEDNKEYIAIVLNQETLTRMYVIKLFDENLNNIGELSIHGKTTYVIEHDSKPYYELEEDAIYTYKFSENNETGDFAQHKYTIKNNRMIDTIIETYKYNEEEGTFYAGAS